MFLGAPGAGKGTQAAILGERLNFSHISTGEILREEVRKATCLGGQVRQIMEVGELVPDELVTEIVCSRITPPDGPSGFLLDGFPRNIAQAECLDQVMEAEPVYVINIQVHQDELVKRLSGRRSCPNCGKIYNVWFSLPEEDGICGVCDSALIQRKDDREEVIVERLRVYQEQTKPLIDYYAVRGTYFEVDGNQDVTEVSYKLSEIIADIF